MIRYMKTSLVLLVGERAKAKRRREERQNRQSGAGQSFYVTFLAIPIANIAKNYTRTFAGKNGYFNYTLLYFFALFL